MKRLTGGRGTVTVEAALVLPLLLLILVGSLEFGTLFSTYIRLQNAIREGARFAALGASESEIEARIATFAPGIDSDDLTITVTNAEGDRGDPVVVAGAYSYNTNTMLMSLIVGSPFNMSYQTTMRLE